MDEEEREERADIYTYPKDIFKIGSDEKSEFFRDEDEEE